MKSLFVSRELLLEEMKNLSSTIGQPIDDFHDADLNLGRFEFVGSSLKTDLPTGGGGFYRSKMGVGHLAGMLQNILEVLVRLVLM